MTLYKPQYEKNPLFDEIYDFLKPYGFVHIETELSGDGNWGDAIFEKQSSD